ncbi:MAG: glycoside hydrolase family 20 zincin-like fold domain-containing protein [Acidobacteriaceae bacterium]
MLMPFSNCARPRGSVQPLNPLSLSLALSVAALLLFGLCCSGGALAEASAGSGPMLSPQPKEIRTQELVPVRAAEVVVPGGDAEDLFAAQELSRALRAHGIVVAPAAGSTDLTVRLLRANTEEARQLLAKNQLSFDPAMHDEGYILLSHKSAAGGETIDILGETAAGVFYGVQTLKQLLEGPVGVASVWAATIRDWPSMKYRGEDDDLSRGPFPTMAFMEHQLEVFAAHKVNLYSPYFENTLEYAGDPLAAPPGGALTRDEARRLVAFASRLHIMIVPEQEAFGHVHHVLEYEKYADVAETPQGSVIAPGQPEALPLIKSWFTQIAADFPSPFLHIGADETFDLGMGRTKPAVDQRGLGPVYADFLASIHSTLAPLHRRLLFWGDIGDSDPSAIPGIPKDMIAIPWIYWHEDSYDHDILPFKNQGLETWVAPGDANWSVVFPDESTALDNISGFVAAGQRLGSTGELTTVWDDDGEGLYNQDWFGTLFGAAAGWQAGKADGAAYQASFGPIFFGDNSGRINQAMAEMIAAEGLIDISDRVFWMDPWSPAGVKEGDKLRANIPAGRLHAENAINLIETALASDPSLREKNALLAMELGARRLDFVGLKFEVSDEIRNGYAQAYALRGDHHKKQMQMMGNYLEDVESGCQDLRDGYSLLKTLYRQAWLAENRPYWLDNVMVRYDLRIQLWQSREEQMNTVIEDDYQTHQLAPASSIGIPGPVTPSAATAR